MRRPIARAIAAAPAVRPPRRPIPPVLPRTKNAELATVGLDRMQRQMIDEYGELDRRMQMNAADVARYDGLKRIIKHWFDGMPADADATVEGECYRLHLSARERERRVKSMRGLIAVIGLDKLLEIANVPIGTLEDILGKKRVESLIVEARTGSRRIKAVPKRPTAGKP